MQKRLAKEARELKKLEQAIAKVTPNGEKSLRAKVVELLMA